MSTNNNVALYRFIDCEKWRKEFGTDELPRTFEYKEKPKVSEYYPQYYHKTDKVREAIAQSLPALVSQQTNLTPSRTAAQSTSNNSARST
jgi:hypothetical protein